MVCRKTDNVILNNQRFLTVHRDYSAGTVGQLMVFEVMVLLPT